MKHLLFLCTLLMAACFMATNPAKGTEKPVVLQDQLVGTWKMVSAKWGGKKRDLTLKATTYKHITPTHFMWASIDKKTKEITRSAGGPYTLEGNIYTETVQYGISKAFDITRDKKHSFTCKIVRNKWYQSGELDTGLKIEEVWERVKPGQ